VKRSTAASVGSDGRSRASDQSLAIIQIRNCLLVSIQTELHALNLDLPLERLELLQ
jgi:hypothetical protein